MTKANEHAFPFNEKNDDGTHLVTVGGLTKREYFAAMADIGTIDFPSVAALAGFVGAIDPGPNDFLSILRLRVAATAKIRAMMADALIAELAKAEPEGETAPAIKADDDRLIEWGGGERPTGKKAAVEVQFRDGATDFGHAGSFRWSHCGVAGDITRYRIVKGGEA